jgi:hypothetical protein
LLGEAVDLLEACTSNAALEDTEVLLRVNVKGLLVCMYVVTMSVMVW